MTDELEEGSRIKDNLLVVDTEKKEEDRTKHGEEITIGIIEEVAQSITKMIQVTFETPCKYDDNKLRVLDLKMWVNHNEGERIDFEFYSKPVSNELVIMNKSAMPENFKRTTLTQECLRRLRNTKKELGPDHQNIHLNEFMSKLKKSGYPEKYRLQILKSAKEAYKRILKEDLEGTKPLYRNRNWNREEREKEKTSKKKNWYKKDNCTIQYNTVLFVETTPGGELARQLRLRETELNKNNDWRIKIVEKSGRKLENILQKNNPFPEEFCKGKCFPCTSSKSSNMSMKSNCKKNNIGYKIPCITCKNRGITRVYEGESSRNAKIRGEEHLRGFKNKIEGNPLYKHKLIDHPEEDPQFEMKVVRSFKDPLTRLANEGVRIKERKPGESLNSKSEFHQPPIVRLQVETRKQSKLAQGVAKSK